MEVRVGLFAGIFDGGGKLLLRRRKREGSEAPCLYEGDWELPGGTMEEENIWRARNEKIIGEELAREVEEETGLLIQVPPIPTMHPVLYIDKEKRIVDFAFIIPVGVINQRPTKGENIYVSPKELKELAERPEGERLVSGWGKRMCKMALIAFTYSPNPQYREEAKRMLLEIQQHQ